MCLGKNAFWAPWDFIPQYHTQPLGKISTFLRYIHGWGAGMIISSTSYVENPNSPSRNAQVVIFHTWCGGKYTWCWKKSVFHNRFPFKLIYGQLKQMLIITEILHIPSIYPSIHPFHPVMKLWAAMMPNHGITEWSPSPISPLIECQTLCKSQSRNRAWVMTHNIPSVTHSQWFYFLTIIVSNDNFVCWLVLNRQAICQMYPSSPKTMICRSLGNRRRHSTASAYSGASWKTQSFHSEMHWLCLTGQQAPTKSLMINLGTKTAKWLKALFRERRG